MLEATRSLFERVQASDFLTGRQPNKTGWTATFDWLFDNGSNWVKVQEGNYDNDRGARGHQSGSQAAGVQLGVGEYYDGAGRRTYGTGKATIPPTAPPARLRDTLGTSQTNLGFCYENELGEIRHKSPIRELREQKRYFCP